MAPARTQHYFEFIVPADGTSAAIVRNGDFGTSPLFWAALGQAAASEYLLRGVSDIEAQ
jgi:hypothetical protein